MSTRTIKTCDVCMDDVGSPYGAKSAVPLKFDFGDGCTFDGDACEACIQRFRTAIRGARRYGDGSPSFRLPAQPAEIVEAAPDANLVLDGEPL